LNALAFRMKTELWTNISNFFFGLEKNMEVDPFNYRYQSINISVLQQRKNFSKKKKKTIQNLNWMHKTIKINIDGIKYLHFGIQ